MYRFLLTPRWLAAAALTVVASVIMVFLGNWQLHRYQERSAINQRIDFFDWRAAPEFGGRPGDCVVEGKAEVVIELGKDFVRAEEEDAVFRLDAGGQPGFRLS